MIPEMTPEQRKEFVIGVCDERIFCSGQLQRGAESIVGGLVFMPVLFGAILPEDIKHVGCVWEWMDKAGPRSISGYPTFTTCNIMGKEDWGRAVTAIAREFHRRKEMVTD